MVSGVSVDYYPPPDHSHSYNNQYESHQEQSYKYHHSPNHRQHVQYQPNHSHQQYHDKHEKYEKPANYEFGYSVHDEHTGDIKSHTEHRNGDTVQGRYELIDPDGYKRIVEYTADAHNGFNAVVRREPTDIKIPVPETKPVPQKYYQPQKYYVSAQPQPQPKYYTYPTSPPPPKPSTYFTPAVKYSQPSPQPLYYAPPKHPKFYKPTVEKTHDYTVFTPAPSYYPSAASPQQMIEYSKSTAARMPMTSLSSTISQKYAASPNHVSVETPQVKYEY